MPMGRRASIASARARHRAGHLVMPKSTFPRWLALTLGLALLLLLVNGVAFYRAQERRQRQSTEAELLAIAHLKVDQIARWRAERLADAAVLRDSPFFVAGVVRWMASPDAQLAESVLARFRSLRDHCHYDDVLFVDAAGQVRLSLGDTRDPFDAEVTQALASAWSTRQPVLTDFHAGSADRPPHLDVITPIFVPAGAVSEPVGAVILQVDVAQFLYPLIQSWPTSSRSAETLLVRRDGEDVLFLNELRHQKATALALRIPLSRTDVPAVQAALGHQGVLQGHDYRGVEVLSVLKAVPDSPWCLVAKVDTAEIFALWRFLSVLILALFVLLAAGAVALVALVWQRNEKAHYQALAQVETSLRASEERYRTTLLSVGDAVIATNAAGHVEFLNPVAEVLTGWRRADAQGRPLEEVFRVINEETRAEIENPVVRVLREGAVVGLANHTLLVARDGTERPIADSGAPIRDAAGRVTGVVLVFHDQTAERAAQDALQASELRYRRLFEAAKDGILIVAAETGIVLDVNPFLADLLGFTRVQVVGKTLWELGFLKDVAANQAKFAELCREQYVRYENLPLEAADGRRLDVEFVSNVYRVDHRQVIQCNIRDNTERRRAERECAALVELLRLINTNNDIHTLMRSATAFLQDATGCEAVGVRLRAGDDFPYFETRGFSAEFVNVENRLCAVDQRGEPVRDLAGNAVLECMCGNILCGRFDPAQPFFTAHGSFWTNCTTELLARTTEAERRAPTRNRCNTAGYESVALLPLRAGSTTFGLLQFNDRRRGCFTPDLVAMLERFADHLAIGLAHRQAVAALAESEQRFQELFDHMGEGVAIYRAVDEGQDFVIVDINATGETLSRVRRADIVGRPVTQVFPAVEQVGLLDVFRRVWRTGRPEQHPLTQYADGRIEEWVENHVYQLPSGLIVALYSDTTEKRRAEKALRESEQRYRTVADFTYDWEYWTGPDGKFLYCSPACERITGYRAQEFERDSGLLAAIVHPDDRSRVTSHIDQSPDACPESYELEYRILTRSGQERWIAHACRAVQDRAGTYLGRRASNRDITARKRAEEALRASEGRYRELVQNANSAILRWTRDGTITFCNEYAQAFFGYSQDEIVGRHVSILVPERDSTGTDLTGLIQSIVDHPEQHADVVNQNVCCDGRRAWMTWTNKAILDDQGQVAEILAIGTDITARKQAEEALRASEEQLRQAQKMEAVGRLAGGVAHDLNNTLTAIFGYLDLVRCQLPPRHAVSASLDGLEHAAQQAAGVTRGLLAFSGRTSPTKRTLALDGLLPETIRMLRHMLPASIEIVADVPPDPTLAVYADPTQIQQVLINLALNARDAMSEGGRLSITLSESQETPDSAYIAPARLARITVRDTGVGIPPEVCARIFEPFFTTKTRGQGTGLGLAIVHGILRDHGGRIEVESTPGHGTAMTVLLPVVAPVSGEVAVAAPSAVPAGRRAAVLLAEDQAHVRRVLVNGLEAVGYDVVEAVDGEELQQRFREASDRLRLLIFDIDLPKRSGRACLQEIRAAGCRTPAILITGKVEADLAEGLDGHTTLLRKPFRVMQLAELAGRMLAAARTAEIQV
jgi:PAS domain S-box-containing protein